MAEIFTTTDQRVRVGGVLEDTLRGVETANVEFPLVTKDGRRVEVLLNATSRRDAAEETAGLGTKAEQEKDKEAGEELVGPLHHVWFRQWVCASLHFWCSKNRALIS